MDLKGFVDRAKEAANTAAQKAQEAASALSAAAGTPAGAASAPAAAAVESEDPAEGTELALAESALPEGALAESAPAPAPVSVPASVPASVPGSGKSFSTLANEKLNELSAAGSQKIQDLVSAFQQALPAIKSAGYEMTEFEVELGVTPKLIPHFRHAAKSAEDVDLARTMLKDNKLGMMILVALLKAGEVHKQIKVAGFAFTHIEIELGLIPSVRLQYKNALIG